MFKTLQASAKDIPLIRELTFKTWPQTYSSILSQEQIVYMLDLMYSESSLKKQMEEGCRFFILYDDDKAIGFSSHQDMGDGVFKLHKIYLLQDQQGKGAGKFLMNAILEEIKKKDAAALQLQVNRYNKAKEFYERLGFKVLHQADFDIGNGYFMNDFVMEKKLR